MIYIEELERCAIAQGYGRDLNPLYRYQVISLQVYLQLYNIFQENKA